MKIKITYEFTKSERQAIAKDKGIGGLATSSDCKKWAATIMNIELSEMVERMYSKRHTSKDLVDPDGTQRR